MLAAEFRLRCLKTLRTRMFAVGCGVGIACGTGACASATPAARAPPVHEPRKPPPPVPETPGQELPGKAAAIPAPPVSCNAFKERKASGGKCDATLAALEAALSISNDQERDAQLASLEGCKSLP